MKLTIYSPDISCESCVTVLERVFAKLQGIESHAISKKNISVTYDQSLITSAQILDAVRAKGYRASLQPSTRKAFGTRVKDFCSNTKKYAVEHTLLRYIVVVFVLFLLVDFLLIYYTGATQYAWWLVYLSVSVVALAGAVLHFKAYTAHYTCMVGMMIGMTVGMQTGMLIGAVLGVTNGFFTGALVGMLLASAVGAYCGSCCGVMGIMEGVMAGIMGGTMGAMITVMMVNNNLLYFMPPFVVLNLVVLVGLSYMIFEEVVEDNAQVVARAPTFTQFFTVCALVFLALVVIMLYTPASLYIAG